MRAAIVNGPGDLPECAEFPDPVPVAVPGRAHQTDRAHEQEVLHLVGAGLHHVVRGLASGRHYGSDHTYPLVPGIDAVARTGDGHLVYTGFPRSPWGTMAERMVTPFQLDLPAGADPLAVAAGMNPGMSGWMALVARRKEVGRLGTVLVLGATGMSGSLAVAAALTLGAERVIAAGRDPEALERLRERGAVPVSLVKDGPDALADALVRSTDEAPPSLVLDFLWGPVAEAAFVALGRGGVDENAPETAYVQIGSLAGDRAALPAALLRSRRLRVTGSGIGAVSRAELLAEAPAVLAHFGDGTFHAPYTAYPLSQVGDAWAHEGRTRAVVVPD